jgi:hypothetical protein
MPEQLPLPGFKKIKASRFWGAFRTFLGHSAMWAAHRLIDFGFWVTPGRAFSIPTPIPDGGPSNV